MGEQTIIKDKSELKIKRPKMYKVILHNDDYTTMEFVIEVLVKVFKRNVPEATKVMFDVHKKGIGIAGVYTYDIASTKLAQANRMVEESGFPLKLSVEEE